MITLAILVAEISFWVLLGTALLTRYVLGARRVSTLLLLGLPVVDVALLALVAVDLARGAEATSAHAFAASYLGFTVAFGHQVVSWADRRVAHATRGTPLPERPRKGSPAHVRGLWTEWVRVVVAASIAVVVLALLGLVSGRGALPPDLDSAAGNPLWSQMTMLAVVTAIWFVAGPAFARTSAGERAHAGR